MRARISLLIAMSGLVLGIAPIAAAGPARADDRSRLLDGVREIAAPGAPGSLVAASASAEVLVAGMADDGVRAGVVASARLGRGRIVAFSHDGYLGKGALGVADTGRLVRNAVLWLSRRDGPARVGVVGLPDLREFLRAQGIDASDADLDADLSRFDVVATVVHRFGRGQAATLRRFVNSGGGLLAGATGWGWKQGSNLPIAELPGNLLIAGSGLAWTDGFAGRTGPEGFRVEGELSPLINADAALRAVESGAALAPADTSQALASVLLALRSLPPGDPSFRPRLRKALDRRKTDLVPTRANAVRPSDPLRRLAVAWETDAAHSSQPETTRRAPAAADFPGAVPDGLKRITRTSAIDTDVPGWHGLGLYAVPGEAITVTIPQEAVRTRLSLRIGAHTDELWHLDSWERAPALSRTFPLNRAKTIAANSFGGLIYVMVPDGAGPGVVPVTASGAVESPLYTLGATTAEEWTKALAGPTAPWAELAGKNLIWTVPTASARSVADPGSLLTLWDEIVAAQDRAVSAPPRRRAERIVADRQISAGYMHSGYPIMAPIDDSLALSLDERRLRNEGAWGHFHELGHNRQKPEWTFGGTGEVTNNVLVLYVFDTVLKLPYDSGHPAIRDRAERARRIAAFRAKGAPFAEWRGDPFLALMMYMQLYEGFGWDPFLKVFAEYESLPEADRPRTDEARRDQWLIRFSRAVGRDLGPFFQAWGVPTSDGARMSLTDLPAWTPAE